MNKAKVKKAVISIVALLVLLAVRDLEREAFSVALDPVFDKFDTSDELFAEIDRQQQLREDWKAYRMEERANGGPAYRIEDPFPETLKPDHWRKFYVLTEIPEGFYYKDRAIESKSPGDWTVTETFHQTDAEENFFFFIQSADHDYNKGHLPKGIKKKKGEIFTEEKGTRNYVYWFDGKLALYLEGNLPTAELKKMAKRAVNYDELEFDYQVVETKE